MSFCESKHDLRSRINNLSGLKEYFELRINMIHFIYFNSCPLTCRAFIRASWLIDRTCVNKLNWCIDWYQIEDPFIHAYNSVAEDLEDNLDSNLLSIRHVELSNSFKSLELDTDSSRGSRESLDSVASSLTDEQSLDKVRRRSSQTPIMTNVQAVETSVSISHSLF